MTTVRTRVSTARLATVRTPKVMSSSTTSQPHLFSSTSSSRTPKNFPAIGKPHDCNAPDAERACNTFCCTPPLPIRNGIATGGSDYSNSRSTNPQSSNTPFSDDQLSGGRLAGEFSSARLSIDDNTISSPGPQAVRREEETSSSREELIAENLVQGSREALGGSVGVPSSSGEELTADNLVGEVTNLVEAEEGENEDAEEDEEEMEADQPESRRVMREEEVTSERDQTVLNLIDGDKEGEVESEKDQTALNLIDGEKAVEEVTSERDRTVLNLINGDKDLDKAVEDEAAPGEEESHPFVESLLQRKPGLPGSNLEVEGDEPSGLSEARSPFLTEEKDLHEGVREGGEGSQEPRTGRVEGERIGGVEGERDRGGKKEVVRSNQIERESGKEEAEEASGNSTGSDE